MIPYSTQLIDSDDIKAVESALKSSFLTQGNLVKDFENAICQRVGAKYAICFNSATSALYALYGAFLYKQFPHFIDSKKHSLDSAPKMAESTQPIYFITSPISFVATTNMMLEWGIVPIFCDVKDDGNMDENVLDSILQNHPKKAHIKAIVSVDYAGKSVEIESIANIAREHNIALFSDSSHSFGGSFKGRAIGGLANASIFSFHAVKPITTAEGGAITTNDEALAHFARLIQSHGVQRGDLWHYECQMLGFNFRLHELSAALGLSQIKKIDSFIKARNDIATLYDKAFSDNPHFKTINVPSHITSTRHLYPIMLLPHLWEKKAKIFKALQERGLGVQVHYKPIYQFALYKTLFGNITLPNAEAFYNAEISIPCHQGLSLESAKEIARIVLEVCEKA